MGERSKGYSDESPVRGLINREFSEALIALLMERNEFTQSYERICRVFGLSEYDSIESTCSHPRGPKNLPRFDSAFREKFDFKLLHDLHLALSYSEDHLPVPITA